MNGNRPKRLRLVLDPEGVPEIEIKFEYPTPTLGRTLRDAEREALEQGEELEPILAVVANGFDSLAELSGFLVDVVNTVDRSAAPKTDLHPGVPNAREFGSKPRFDPKPRGER